MNPDSAPCRDGADGISGFRSNLLVLGGFCFVVLLGTVISSFPILIFVIINIILLDI